MSYSFVNNVSHSSRTVSSTIARRLLNLWLFLVEPTTPARGNVSPVRARLLATLQLIFAPSLAFATQWNWTGQLYSAFLILCVPLLGITYWLNRRGYYYPAALTFIVFYNISPYVMLLSINDFGIGGILYTLMWVGTATFQAYLLLDLRGVIIAILVETCVLIFSPFLVGYNFVYMVYPLLFNLVVGGMVIIAAFVRHHDQAQLNARTQALEESENRYRMLFEALFEGVAIDDAGVMVEANASFARMFGYTPETLIGMNVIDLYAPESRERVQSWAESQSSYEARGLRQDGTTFWAEVQTRETVFNGRAMRVVAVRDVTERRMSDQQQIDLAVEREKVNVLQRFIGDLSHDLRTPLSVIKTSVYLLDRVRSDGDKFQHQLKALQSQTDHLQRLLDDLLSMSRLDKADTRDYRFRWINVNNLLLDLVQEHRELALRKQIQLEYVPGANLPKTLLDENEFKRMIKHLLRNGLNFTPEGGTLHLQTYCESGNVIVVEVSDTGMGISAHDLPHIFDRFYRADPARQADRGGTGLGLSIAKKIVEAHGGTIEAESAVNKGSRFRIRLLVAQPLPEAANTAG